MRTRTYVVLAAILATTGCGSSPTGSPTSPAASADHTEQASSAPGAAKPAAADGDVIVVLSNGDEPRRALRYVFHEGTHETMQMDMRTTMRMAVGDHRPPAIELPVMRMLLTLDAVRVQPNGDLVYRYALASAKVVGESPDHPEIAQAITVELAKLAGLAGEIEMDTRGKVEHATLEPPPNASEQIADVLDQVRTSMRDLAVPLPEPPVGRNARWKATQSVDLKALKATRAVTYTLTDLDGPRGTLASVVELSAPTQPLAGKKFPPGTKATLESLTASGVGSTKFDLGRLSPTGNVDLDLMMIASIEQEGQDGKMPLHVSTKTSISVEPAKP